MGTRLDAFPPEILATFASVPIAMFSAEMPSGPFRTTVAPTEAVATPLHPNPVAPTKPNVVVLNTRQQHNGHSNSVSIRNGKFIAVADEVGSTMRTCGGKMRVFIIRRLLQAIPILLGLAGGVRPGTYRAEQPDRPAHAARSLTGQRATMPGCGCRGSACNSP
jgi:hypothetical protein